MIRRILSLTAALVLLLTALPVSAEETAAQTFQVDYSHLKVASPTPLTGHFFTSLWGASTADLDVQELLHRYKIVVYDDEMGRYRMNHLVVTGAVTQDDEAGNRTYYVSLYDDLTYSDGSPITAWDYAFTLLLMIDPAVRETGGVPADESWIQGEEEYLSGEAKSLRGLRVINDQLLAVTVKAEALPYFYELSRLRISPYPIQVIAPDCRILDDGEGVYLTPGLTGELLRRTVLDSYSGYMMCPKIVSGPYTIESYRDGKAHFLINPCYKGNQKGETPAIPELTYSSAEKVDIIQGMESGEYGLVNKVTKAGTIQWFFRLMQEYPDRYSMTSYPRTGLAVLRFTPRSPRVQETEVRKAVFHCIDRESIVKDYTGGFGMPVKGMYGVGQWMVRLLDGPASYPIYLNEDTATPEDVRAYEQALEEWQSMNMSAIPEYELDVTEAVRLLEENGWNLNRFGEPYESGVRYKRMESGELVGLNMTAAIPKNMREILEKHWLPYMGQAGFGLELADRDIWDLAETYRRDSYGEWDMVFIGEDFTDKFRLNGGYRRFDEPGETQTPLEILNDRIDAMSREVYHTEQTDLQGFIRKWLDTQVEIAETVPLIPLYSNVYFDFYIAQLRDYRVEDNLGWANAIVAAWLGEAPKEKTEETAEAEEAEETQETEETDEAKETEETENNEKTEKMNDG